MLIYFSRFIRDGEHFIPCVYSMVPHYLAPEAEDSMKVRNQIQVVFCL
jgi:hypothetical protein